MEVIKQMMAQRAAMGLDNTLQNGDKKPTGQHSKTPAPLPPHAGQVKRKSLREMRDEIVKKKPAGKKVKKFFEEAIERLTAESSDDDDI